MGRFLSGACQDNQDDQENQSPNRLLAGSWQDDQDDQEHQNPVRRPPGSWHPNNLLMCYRAMLSLIRLSSALELIKYLVLLSPICAFTFRHCL